MHKKYNYLYKLFFEQFTQIYEHFLHKLFTYLFYSVTIKANNRMLYRKNFNANKNMFCRIILQEIMQNRNFYGDHKIKKVNLIMII